MRFVSEQELDSIMEFPALVEAMAEAHRGEKAKIGDLLLRQPGTSGAEDAFFSRAAWLRGVALGIKSVSVFPGNVEREPAMPSVQGVFLLFDGEDGRVVCAIDGAAITRWKTAADSALGAKLLARKGLRDMVMVGAGTMAEALIEAHCALQPSIERVRIWNRTAARAQELAERLSARGLPVEATADLEAAVREAELISAATMTKQPLIQGRWLAAGAHLDLIGAFTPEMREADDEALRRARLFVDSRETTLEDTGELAIPIAAGVIGEADVLADLYELCAGRAGREGPDEITLFKNGGGAHLDLMTAGFAAGRLGLLG